MEYHCNGKFEGTNSKTKLVDLTPWMDNLAGQRDSQGFPYKPGLLGHPFASGSLLNELFVKKGRCS